VNGLQNMIVCSKDKVSTDLERSQKRDGVYKPEQLYDTRNDCSSRSPRTISCPTAWRFEMRLTVEATGSQSCPVLTEMVIRPYVGQQ
jgi:hypothetical protein